MASKPIRVFWSTLSNRFYASRAYRELPNGIVVITGQKFDVTDEIAHAIVTHDIGFKPVLQEPQA